MTYLTDEETNRELVKMNQICENCGQREEQHNKIIHYAKDGTMYKCKNFTPKKTEKKGCGRRYEDEKTLFYCGNFGWDENDILLCPECQKTSNEADKFISICAECQGKVYEKGNSLVCSKCGSVRGSIINIPEENSTKTFKTSGKNLTERQLSNHDNSPKGFVLEDKIFDIDNWNRGATDKDIKKALKLLEEKKIWIHHNETNQECNCITWEDLVSVMGESLIKSEGEE